MFSGFYLGRADTDITYFLLPSALGERSKCTCVCLLVSVCSSDSPTGRQVVMWRAPPDLWGWPSVGGTRAGMCACGCHCSRLFPGKALVRSAGAERASGVPSCTVLLEACPPPAPTGCGRLVCSDHRPIRAKYQGHKMKQAHLMNRRAAALSQAHDLCFPEPRAASRAHSRERGAVPSF